LKKKKKRKKKLVKVKSKIFESGDSRQSRTASIPFLAQTFLVFHFQSFAVEKRCEACGGDSSMELFFNKS
jgi:hypothetical protein